MFIHHVYSSCLHFLQMSCHIYICTEQRKTILSAHFGFWSDPVNHREYRHGEENPQRDQKFPGCLAAPPPGEISTPNGGQHLLADGMSHKLEVEKKGVKITLLHLLSRLFSYVCIVCLFEDNFAQENVRKINRRW